MHPSCQTLGVVKNQMRNSEPQSWLQAIGFNTPHMNARASTKLASQIWKAVVLRIASKNTSQVLALKREREQMLVSQ